MRSRKTQIIRPFSDNWREEKLGKRKMKQEEGKERIGRNKEVSHEKQDQTVR
jgi:hypothetical protein